MARVLALDSVEDHLTIEERILGDELTRTPNSLVEVILVHHAFVDSATMDAYPRLRGIVRYGVGFDRIDIAAASARNISICNIPDYCVDEVSDTTIAFALCISRGLFETAAAAKASPHLWQRNRLPRVRRTNQLQLGIVGAGRIGTSVLLKAKSMGFQVAFFDPYVRDGIQRSLGVRRATSIEDLLRESDIVTLHVPANAHTVGMVNKAFLDHMKPGAALINTARGGLIADEGLLLAYLKERRLGALATDVFREEPPLSSPLYMEWTADTAAVRGRLLVTPHTAFYSLDSSEEVRARVCEEASRLLRGEQPLHAVNLSTIG
jgi:D-3-phosphoglycerate dehydrogenase